MRFVSWNVNGIRACAQKGFDESIKNMESDVICIQETKISEGQFKFSNPQYECYYNYAEKKGYSGTAVFTKIHPVSVVNGIGIEEFDHEGRVITAEYSEYYLVCVYTPNTKEDLSRLEYRGRWDDAFRSYLKELEKKKPVITCGDFNCAHEEIDIKNAKANRGHAGFTDEERNKFTQLLDSGFIDTFRYYYPDLKEAYSWWSYRFSARERNAGWRIDYFLVSASLKDRLTAATIHADITGSDHCPVELDMD
jgi:exodeoxyribonuclease III